MSWEGEGEKEWGGWGIVVEVVGFGGVGGCEVVLGVVVVVVVVVEFLKEEKREKLRSDLLLWNGRRSQRI